MAMVFIPTADVIVAYELIMESEYYEHNSDQLDEFLRYFEATWIGKIYHNKKKREKRFNRNIGVYHASIGMFLRSVKDEQIHTELNMNQIITG